ncbi:hypothetical protein ACFX2J_042383 [Malus domestica]
MEEHKTSVYDESNWSDLNFAAPSRRLVGCTSSPRL